MPTEYPQFINNSAIGEDKFPEKAQESVATAISDLILSKESKSKIIGLEGEWGSGKTNAIEIIKKKLNKSHHVYVHDVWSYQEDLQRRTFLESLTTDLCKNSFLQNQSKWSEELKHLLAKRKEVTTDITPVLSSGFLFLIILIALWTLTAGLSFPFKFHDYQISLRLCVFISGVAGYIYYSKEAKRLLLPKDIFYIYRQQETKRITNETIFESEPSPERFFKWVSDLQKDFLQEKELVVVFDNMDRLPKEKIRQMWALIHAFFAEKHFEKIWVIVPYSRQHLQNGFDSDDEQTDHFIDKTFTIQYQISPPILSDWKAFFNDIFIQAYGNDESELTAVRSTFDRLCKNITPRKIINFINETVSLKKIWGDKIPLRYIALFVQTKRIILASPTQQILKKEFLGQASFLFEDDSRLQDYIAALVYNIPLTSATQIAVQQDLIRILRNGVADKENMTAFAKQPFFLDLMETIIADEPDTKGFALGLDSIDSEVYSTLDTQKIDTVWQILEINKNKKIRDKQEFDVEDQIILKRISSNRRQMFLDRILVDLDRQGEAFSGKDYFNTMTAIEKFIESNTITNIKFKPQLKSPIKNPNVFMDYLKVAGDNYLKYGLKAENKSLNDYIILNFKGEGESLCLKYLSANKDYDLSPFTKHLKESIKEEKVAIPVLTETLDLLKELSKGETLSGLISVENLHEYFDEVSFADDEIYPDLIAIGFGLFDSIDENTEIYEIFNSEDEDLIKAVAACSKHYVILGDLFKHTVNETHLLIIKTAKHIVLNNKDDQKLSIVSVLTTFDVLHTELELEAKVLLGYLDRWADSAKDKITKENIENIVSLETLQDIAFVKNELCAFLLNTYKDFITNLSEEKTKAYLINSESNTYKALLFLIDGGFFTEMPINIVSSLSKLFEDVAAGTVKLPSQILIWNKICNAIPISLLSGTYKNVMDLYIKKQTISLEEFSFFAPKFQVGNIVVSKEGDFCRTILSRVLDYPNVLEAIILPNSAYYAQIIKNAGDDAGLIREKINEKVKVESANTNLASFAAKIGIEVSKDDRRKIEMKSKNQEDIVA